MFIMFLCRLVYHGILFEQMTYYEERRCADEKVIHVK